MAGATETASGDDIDIPQSPDLPLDIVFELLKNQRRRMLLEELRSTDGALTIGELSETIAARENEKPVSAVTSDERKRVYVGLYQCHLPKMDDAGVIEFDKDRGVVEPGDHLHVLEQYLSPGAKRALVGTERFWSGATVLLGGALVMCLVVGSISGAPLSLLVLAAMFVVAGCGTVRQLTET